MDTQFKITFIVFLDRHDFPCRRYETRFGRAVFDNQHFRRILVRGQIVHMFLKMGRLTHDLIHLVHWRQFVNIEFDP